jgi:hypothetical protein
VVAALISCSCPAPDFFSGWEKLDWDNAKMKNSAVDQPLEA